MRTVFTIFSVLLAALCLPACAGLLADSARNYSAAKLGCPNDEIAVSHVNFRGMAGSWVAECNGKTLVCTAVSNPNSSTVVDCSPPSAPQSK